MVACQPTPGDLLVRKDASWKASEARIEEYVEEELTDSYTQSQLSNLQFAADGTGTLTFADGETEAFRWFNHASQSTISILGETFSEEFEVLEASKQTQSWRQEHFVIRNQTKVTIVQYLDLTKQ
ncbi:MAG: hypothetical protein AAFR61_07255 [Bacteroidota bacterium]